MFEQKFAFSLVVFVHMRLFHLEFYCFFGFYNWIFFLNGFPRPSIVHYRPAFLFESIFQFSLVFFCSHAAF